MKANSFTINGMPFLFDLKDKKQNLKNILK